MLPSRTRTRPGDTEQRARERLPTSSLAGSPSCSPRRSRSKAVCAQRCEIAARLVVSAEATEDRDQGRRVAELLAQRPRPSVCLPGSHRGVTDRGDESCRKDDSAARVPSAHVRALSGRRSRRSKPLRDCATASIMPERSTDWRAALSQYTIACSAKPGLGEVVGEQLRLGLRDLREPLLEHLGDAGVQLLALALEQRAGRRRPAPARA